MSYFVEGLNAEGERVWSTVLCKGELEDYIEGMFEEEEADVQVVHIHRPEGDPKTFAELLKENGPTAILDEFLKR